MAINAADLDRYITGDYGQRRERDASARECPCSTSGEHVPGSAGMRLDQLSTGPALFVRCRHCGAGAYVEAGALLDSLDGHIDWSEEA